MGRFLGELRQDYVCLNSLQDGAAEILRAIIYGRSNGGWFSNLSLNQNTFSSCIHLEFLDYLLLLI